MKLSKNVNITFSFMPLQYVSIQTGSVFNKFLTDCTLNTSYDLLRYPLGREGVYGPGVHAFLAHTKQKVSNIVGLTALRLAFFMGYE